MGRLELCVVQSSVSGSMCLEACALNVGPQQGEKLWVHSQWRDCGHPGFIFFPQPLVYLGHVQKGKSSSRALL